MDDAVENNLAECLAAKGIKQSQLARRFGLSRAHVSRLVRGTVMPSLGLALRFAKYFGRPLDSIFALAETRQQTISPASLGSVGEPTIKTTPRNKKG
jgi:transcriptional regulator with XRE-family HTH domain